MKPTLFTLALCLCAVGANAADLAGGWSGTWTKDGDALPVTATFAGSGGGDSGSFDSDALQVAGIPFSNVHNAGDTVHFEIKGDQSTTIFDGTLAGDALSGTFVDGSAKGSFTMARATLPAAAVGAREVTFQNGDVTLSGTLLLPASAG
ncbi:MAG TPA: hypothetical protein VN932_03675, partial [Rhizomicrobium sp.]|nr:hypothetical protein [Rhizomicrobium sp.]